MTAVIGSTRAALGPMSPVAGGLLALTACAWVLLLAGGHLGFGWESLGPGTHSAHHHHIAGSHAMNSIDRGHPESPTLAGAMLAWALMTLAMMTPGLIPMAQSWRGRTLRRRWWATSTIVSSYYLTWVVAGWIAIAILGAHQWPPWSGVVLLLLAAAWQLTPVKQWALVEGHRSAALRLNGWQASVSEVRVGIRHSAICMVSCWAVMAPMMIGVQPMGVLMVVGTTTVTAERLSRTPNRARRLTAALLALSAAAIAAASLN